MSNDTGYRSAPCRLPSLSQQSHTVVTTNIEERLTPSSCGGSRVRQLTALFEHRLSSELNSRSKRFPETLSDIPAEAIALANDVCDTARTMGSTVSGESHTVKLLRRNTCTQQAICIERPATNESEFSSCYESPGLETPKDDPAGTPPQRLANALPVKKIEIISAAAENLSESGLEFSTPDTGLPESSQGPLPQANLKPPEGTSLGQIDLTLLHETVGASEAEQTASECPEFEAPPTDRSCWENVPLPSSEVAGALAQADEQPSDAVDNLTMSIASKTAGGPASLLRETSAASDKTTSRSSLCSPSPHKVCDISVLKPVVSFKESVADSSSLAATQDNLTASIVPWAREFSLNLTTSVLSWGTSISARNQNSGNSELPDPTATDAMEIWLGSSPRSQRNAGNLEGMETTADDLVEEKRAKPKEELSSVEEAVSSARADLLIHRRAGITQPSFGTPEDFLPAREQPRRPPILLGAASFLRSSKSDEGMLVANPGPDTYIPAQSGGSLSIVVPKLQDFEGAVNRDADLQMNCFAQPDKRLSATGSLKRKRITKRCSFHTDDDYAKDREPLTRNSEDLTFVGNRNKNGRLPTLTRKRLIRVTTDSSSVRTSAFGRNLTTSSGELDPTNTSSANFEGSSSSLDSRGSADTDDVPSTCRAVLSIISRTGSMMSATDVDTAYMKFFPRVPPSMSYHMILDRQSHQCPSCSRLLLLPRNMAADLLGSFAEATGLDSLAARLTRSPPSEKRAFALPPEPSLYCCFSGLLFCQGCHIREAMVLPANVISAWDFTTQEISRPAARFLRQHQKSPFLQYKAIHPAVKKMIPGLVAVHGTRKKVIMLKDFFLSGRKQPKDRSPVSASMMACDKGASGFCSTLLKEILPHLPGEYWLSTPDLYSVVDLEAINQYNQRTQTYFLSPINWGPMKSISDAFGCKTVPLTARGSSRPNLPETRQASNSSCSAEGDALSTRSSPELTPTQSKDAFIVKMESFVTVWQTHVQQCTICTEYARSSRLLANMD